MSAALVLQQHTLPIRVAPNKWLVAASVGLGSMMGAIDSSIVNVALPQMRGSLGVTLEEITWVTTGYVMAMVLVMPLTAFLGALFGQKQAYLFSFFLFLAGSLLCGMARSLPTMVIFRLIQGFGAGALQPTTMIVIRQTFPPKELGMAMALFTMTVMIGPAVGPTLGGWLVDNYSWPWIFYVNLPVGVVGYFMVLTFVHEPDDIREANRLRAEHLKRNLDWQGVLLLGFALIPMQYVLEEGNRNDWFESTTITLCCAVSVFALAALVIQELTCAAPILNLRLFKETVFATGTVIGALANAMLLANMFLLPVFMQELLGFSATQAGIALMPRVLVLMIVSPIVGRLYGRVQPRVLVGVGVAFYVLSAWQMRTFNLQTGTRNIVGVLLLQGIGFAFLMVPLTTIAISRIPRTHVADASGLNAVVRQIGGSVGLAVFGTLISRLGFGSRASLASHVCETSPEVWSRLNMLQGSFMRHGLDVASAHVLALRTLTQLVATQGTVLTFDRLFLLAGVVFLFILPFLLLLRSPESARVETVEVHVE